MKRAIQRGIYEDVVLGILENRTKSKRSRNKKKDVYVKGFSDWNYCIEGLGIDRERIRIILTFDVNHMLIITVMKLDEA